MDERELRKGGIGVSNIHYINVCHSQRINLIKMRTIVDCDVLNC